MKRKLLVSAFAALAVLAAIIAASALWNDMWSWLPWSAESKLARSEQARDHAESDAFARGLESEGEREQAQRVETFHTSEVVIRDLTTQSITESRSAPNANDPLDLNRLAGLHAGDRRLCDVAPEACPSPAAAPVDP